MGIADSSSTANRNAIAAGCAAIFLVSANYLLFGDIDLNVADEGFFWYGAERTALGEVPLRDFQSYEPGRYYWAALGSFVFGDGIVALRLSTAVFQTLGLACGLLVASRLISKPVWLFPIGLVLLLWMTPRYKLFEPSLAMMAVYVALRLLEERNRAWFFRAGIFVGLVSFFGRNHALYAGLGVLVLTFWLSLKQNDRPLITRLSVLAAGGCVGTVPLVGMMLFVPGFAVSFWDSVVFFIEHGANLPAPIPWPWRVDYAGMPWTLRTAHFSMGAAFLLVPLVYGIGIVVALRGDRARRPAQSVLIAATAVGIFYLHHAAVRSDASHLTQAIHPALLASIAIPSALGLSRRSFSARAIWSALALLTISATPFSNSAFALPWQAKAKSLVRLEVAGDQLRLPPGVAGWISRIDHVVRSRVAANEPLFIAPNTPGLYSVLGKRSPVWGLYFLWKADEESQDRLIRRLEREGVNWALISTGAIDGRNALRFWNTHERVWEHFRSQFEFIRDPRLPRGFLLVHRILEVPNASVIDLEQQPATIPHSHPMKPEQKDVQ